MNNFNWCHSMDAAIVFGQLVTIQRKIYIIKSAINVTNIVELIENNNTNHIIPEPNIIVECLKFLRLIVS